MKKVNLFFILMLVCTLGRAATFEEEMSKFVVSNTIGAEISFYFDNQGSYDRFAWEWSSSDKCLISTIQSCSDTQSYLRMVVNVSQIADVSFDYFVSSETNCDKLIIYGNGISVIESGRDKRGTVTATLPAGQHTIEFMYDKDESGDSFDDMAKLSNFRIAPSDVSNRQCGDDAYWSLNGTGVLRITGTGALWSYDQEAWYPNLTKLTTVVVEDGITELPKQVFKSCPALKSVNISNTVETIGYQAFMGCQSLTNVVLGNGLKVIPTSCFENCFKLFSVELGNVVTIGQRAFCDCSSLKSLYVPSSAKYILDDAFLRCYGMTVSVANLEYWCNIEFYNENSNPARHLNVRSSSSPLLTSINWRHSMNAIKKYAFYMNQDLESVAYTDNATSIGESAFALCPNLTTVSLGSKVTSISDRAFAECENLSKVEIPNSVKTIGDEVFAYDEALETITLPSSLQGIELNSFSGCTKLSSVYCFAPIVPASLNGWDINAILYVNKGMKQAFDDDYAWGRGTFENIVENRFDQLNQTPVDLTISSAMWSTLILPYEATIPSGLTVYSCNSSADGLLTLEEQDKIKANTPYVVFGEPDTYHFSGVGSAWEDTYTDGWFTGAYVDAEVPENSYILAKVSGVVGFYKVTGDNVGKAKVAPFRCYLTPDAGDPVKAFYFEGMETAITEKNIGNDGEVSIYDLNGRKLSAPRKGINIINGVKVIVK